MHSAKGGWSRRIRGSSHCSRAFGNPASYNTVLQDTHARTVGWGMGDGGCFKERGCPYQNQLKSNEPYLSLDLA